MEALKGIRVIDFSTYAFGPGASAILGDWGADVMKIEDPVTGDPWRGTLTVAGLPMGKINYIWEFDNRNKRSVAIDLKNEQGKKIIYRMIEESDVFLSNIPGESLTRIGLDYETLSKINPKLIYAHGSGYGEKGPEHWRLGFDYAAFWARSSIMNSLGEPGAPPPQCLPALGDHTSSVALAGGVVLALFVRERTGIGQEVNVALLGTALWCNGISIAAAGSTEELPKLSRKESRNPLYNSYKCRDDKWLMLVCLQSDRYWSSLCRVMGLEDLEGDRRFNNIETRKENCAELISILDRTFSTKDRMEWGKAFDENGILWTVVQSAKEAINDPQALANEFVVEVDHPVHGVFRNVSSPVRLSKTPPKITRVAPEHGQHTEEVLLEMGYSWDEIAVFKDSKAIL